jgi:hypothetical protein
VSICYESKSVIISCYRYSVISTVRGYVLVNRTVVVRFPGETRYYFLKSVQTGSGAHRGVKRSDCGADRSPDSAKVKTELNYMSCTGIILPLRFTKVITDILLAFASQRSSARQTCFFPHILRNGSKIEHDLLCKYCSDFIIPSTLNDAHQLTAPFQF